MNKPQPLYSLISGRPMMLERKAFDYLLSQANEPTADAKMFGIEGGNNRKDFSIVNGVAIIPVHGALSKRSGIFDALFGFTSYELLSELLSKALDDSDVNSILFDIDSPGGEVAGLFDLADEIFTARGKKTIWAVANEEAFSAAYAIASSAEKVFVSRTSGIGSIGVLATHVDQSSFDEKQGVKITTIFAGDRKNDLNPHEPLTSEATQVLQDEVNRLFEMFIQLVSRNRRMAVQQIRNTEAGLFFGAEGVSVGLADDVLTMPQVLELMTKNFQPKLGTIDMTKQIEAKNQEPATEAVAKTNVASSTLANIQLNSAEKVPATNETVEFKVDIDAIKVEAEAKGREKYRAEVLELAKTCKMAEMPEKLADLVERNIGIQAAKDELMQILVAQNHHGGGEVRSSVVPLDTESPKESPVVAAAIARAEAAKA